MVVLVLSVTMTWLWCCGRIYKLVLRLLITLFDLLSADDIKISLHFLSKSGWAMEDGNREWPGWWQELE